MRHVLPLVSMLCLASPAVAQTVDQAGADQITGNLSRYVGKTAFDTGIVKVAVDGDAYRLVVDLKAIASLLPKELEAKLEIETYALRLKPNSNGTFQVDGPYLPKTSAEFLTPATADKPAMRTKFDFNVDKGVLSGIFDPAIASFSNAKITHGRISFASEDELQSVTAAASDGSTDFWATPSNGKGIDLASSQTVKNFLETVVVKAGDGAAAGPVTIAAKSFDYDTDISSFQNREILALVAFFVERANAKDITGKQAELKTLLRAALPLWNRLRGGYTISDVSVGTPFGPFGAASFGTKMITDGIGKSGSLDYSFDLEGLAMPLGIAPDWATPLLPTDVSLKFGVRQLDSEGPARQLIDAFDLSATPPVPDAVGERIAADFMANPPHVVMERSVVRNKDIEVAVFGETHFPQGKPEVTATVEVAGYDKAVAALQAAATANPDAQTAFTIALAAKGFAKTQPDGRQVWAIELKPDGSLLINGSMLKGPDPAPEPTEEPEAPTP
jgi:hypothetical protein